MEKVAGSKRGRDEETLAARRASAEAYEKARVSLRIARKAFNRSVSNRDAPQSAHMSNHSRVSEAEKAYEEAKKDLAQYLPVGYKFRK